MRSVNGTSSEQSLADVYTATLCRRDVNRETVEYQRPRSMKRFMRTYDEEGIDQLVFEVDGDIVAYAECSYEVTGSDNWINPRYFEKRGMTPPPKQVAGPPRQEVPRGVD